MITTMRIWMKIYYDKSETKFYESKPKSPNFVTIVIVTLFSKNEGHTFIRE